MSTPMWWKDQTTVMDFNAGWIFLPVPFWMHRLNNSCNKSEHLISILASSKNVSSGRRSFVQIGGLQSNHNIGIRNSRSCVGSMLLPSLSTWPPYCNQHRPCSMQIPL